MSGLAFRVPIVNVSVLDLTVRLDTNTTIQDIFKSVEAASKTYLENIIKISNDEAVSSDFIGDSHSCILDADSSLQLKPNFFKIICWYENEYSYACRVLDSIFFSEKQFNKPVRLPCKMTYVRAKIMKKQDEVQQTDRNNKEMSIECNYNTEVPKVLCSTSQETGFKRKQLPRPLILRKPLSSHSSGATATTVSSRDTKKRNELFKIWNDNNDAQKNVARQNRSSFFHSCISFGPNTSEKSDCMKAQERLENVKREFSKMVNITEDLLKKSYNNKFQLDTSAESSKEAVKAAPVGALKTNSLDTTKSVINAKHTKQAANNPIFKVCGDFKTTVVKSPATDCSKEEVRICSSSERNDNNSDYNITGEVKQNIGKKKLYLKTSEEETCMIKETAIINVNQNSAAQNSFMAWANESSKKKMKANNNVHEQVAKTVNNFMNKSNGPYKNNQFQCVANEQKSVVPKPSDNGNDKPNPVEHSEDEIKVVEGRKEPDAPIDKVACDTQTSKPKINKDPDPPETINLRDFNKYLINKDYNMHVIDEELKKRNIVLVNHQKENTSEVDFKTCNIESEPSIVETDEHRNNLELNKQILESLNRMAPEPAVIIPEDNSGCCSPGDTVTTISNGDGKRTKPDLYDKLDSASATDSNNSFEINERKSQVIHITDLTNSLEDLARLDKICRIIEISDELSDKLFSSLDESELTGVQQKKWSFRDLCERIQLDDFCNKVFGKTSV